MNLGKREPHDLASLFDSGVLADLVSKVVQLGAANLASASHFDLGYVRRVDGERSFDSDAVGNLSDIDRFGDAAVLNGDHHAFVHLDSLFSSFANLDANLDGVAGPNFWQIGLFAFLNDTF